MKIGIYPKSLLETVWQKDNLLFAPEAEHPPLCLRCGQPLERRLMDNALSRYADVYICESCGMDEALRDADCCPLPLREWAAVKNGLDQSNYKEPLLIDSCSFKELFEHGTKDSREVVYSRSDYDGYKWWTTWNQCSKNMPEPELVNEIDAFRNALFQLPEIQDLQTMGQLCKKHAEPTSDPTEFNLYLETDHFYIWLSLITRQRDYNVYVHYYQKG